MEGRWAGPKGRGRKGRGDFRPEEDEKGFSPFGFDLNLGLNLNFGEIWRLSRGSFCKHFENRVYLEMCFGWMETGVLQHGAVNTGAASF